MKLHLALANKRTDVLELRRQHPITHQEAEKLAVVWTQLARLGMPVLDFTIGEMDELAWLVAVAEPDGSYREAADMRADYLEQINVIRSRRR